MNQKGLTYIEVLIVLGIIAIFMLVATPSVVKSLSVAKQKATELELGNLDAVLGLYASANDGCYPAALEELTSGGYLRDKRGLTDGFGNPYLYEVAGDGYSLKSCGADRKPGTKDDLLSPASAEGLE